MHYHRHIFRSLFVFLLIITFPHLIRADNRAKFPTQIQLSLGELPHTAFAPGINVGYHINNLIYLGYILQPPFNTEEGGHSVNAHAPGFDGLVSSKSELGYRQALILKLSPFQLGAFISFAVFTSDTDKEYLVFDQRVRTIGSNSYNTSVEIELERPAVVRPAIGSGFNHVFDNGISLSAEFLFAFGGIADPRISIASGVPIAASDREALDRKISAEFTDNIHNRYHLVQVGFGYNF